MRRLIPLLLALALLTGVHAQTEEYKLLWSYETGSGVWSVSITPDGDYIAVGSSYDMIKSTCLNLFMLLQK